MKKYISFILILFSYFLQSMEQQIIRKPQEWNAHDYAKGNLTQEIAALQFLQQSGIDFKNKTVLDIGCGTGNLTTDIAREAKKVHGIDASQNMINYAQEKYGNISNLSFEHCFAENFVTKNPFDKAVCFFCLHWIQDKQQALQQISQALNNNGEFFGTLQSSSDPEPLHFTVLKNMIPGFTAIHSFLKSINLIQDFEYHVISDDEFKQLLSDNKFDLISYEQKSFDIILTKEQLENGIRPILMSRPFMKKMPELIQEWFIEKYIEENIKVLKQKEDGTIIISADLWGTKVFHARKIANI